MHLLLVCRHAEYDAATGHLTAKGRQDAELLGELLKRWTRTAKSVGLVSSSAPRADETADIAGKALGIETYETTDLLWSDDEHSANLEKAVDLVVERSEDHDVLVLVTHYEYCRSLAAAYGKRVLDTRLEEYDDVRNCSVVALFVENKSTRLIK